MFGPALVKVTYRCESGCSHVKVRLRQTDNSAVGIALELGRSSLPEPENPHTAATIEPSRLEVIANRLQQNFYDLAPASERIAAAVLSDLKTFDESSPIHPH